MGGCFATKTALFSRVVTVAFQRSSSAPMCEPLVVGLMSPRVLGHYRVLSDVLREAFSAFREFFRFRESSTEDVVQSIQKLSPSSLRGEHPQLLHPQESELGRAIITRERGLKVIETSSGSQFCIVILPTDLQSACNLSSKRGRQKLWDPGLHHHIPMALR